MADMLRPAHLRDVDEALDTFFQLDECAVVGDRDHFALDNVAFRVALAQIIPRMRLQLLQAKRNTLALLVVVKNDDVELLVEFDELDRKSTRLNSSHVANSYAVFCLKTKN